MQGIAAKESSLLGDVGNLTSEIKDKLPSSKSQHKPGIKKDNKITHVPSIIQTLKNSAPYEFIQVFITIAGFTFLILNSEIVLRLINYMTKLFCGKSINNEDLRFAKEIFLCAITIVTILLFIKKKSCVLGLDAGQDHTATENTQDIDNTQDINNNKDNDKNISDNQETIPAVNKPTENHEVRREAKISAKNNLHMASKIPIMQNRKNDPDTQRQRYQSIRSTPFNSTLSIEGFNSPIKAY